MPEALGLGVELTMFVDASHATKLVTRQSRSGVLIYVNKAPIIWFSKKQNSIETSSFGSEFMALKTGVELLQGLIYKLQMMGVPIEGCCHTCVDNMSVVNNTSLPESVLKNKSNSIAYHYVRSKCAEDILRITYENTNQTWQIFLRKYKLEQRRKLSGTRLCSLVIRVLSLCFRLFSKRFCPPPGALKVELGNTSSKGGTVHYSDIMICKSISFCDDDRFEGSIRL